MASEHKTLNIKDVQDILTVEEAVELTNGRPITKILTLGDTTIFIDLHRIETEEPVNDFETHEHVTLNDISNER